MAWIVFSFGENNLSNDYGLRVPLVMSMLDRTCSLGKYFREAWVAGSHSLIAVTPVYYLNALLFDWSAYVDLTVGLVLAASALALLAAAAPPSTRWGLLPFLSLLLFSTSRVTIFTFGEPALQYGLSQLGVAFAAFALARWPERPVPLAWGFAAGGVLASWSWGGGLVAWPIFFAVFAWLRIRRVAAWAIVAGGAVAGLAQYVWLLPGSLSANVAGRVPWATRAAILLDILGRPFIDGIAYADPNVASQTIGAAGLAALAALFVVLRARRRRDAAALLLIAWALLVAAQIALVRSAVAPWYASPTTFFWAGILMLLSGVPVPVRAAGIAVVALLTLRVQTTWEDKSFYLSSRSPASAACLREWRTAPAECGLRLFQWKGGAPAYWLGKPLEQHRLSVFGHRRTYLLQGDAVLGRTAVTNTDRRAFLSGDGRTPGDLNDFRRLDLVLGPGAAVTWRVDLPSNASSARFETRVRAAPDGPRLARAALVSVAGKAGNARALVPAGGSTPLTLDLRDHAGSTVTLRLAAEEADGGAPLVLEAPRIEIRVRDARN